MTTLNNDQLREMADTITQRDEYQLYLSHERPHKPSEWEQLIKQAMEQLQSLWDKFRELFHLKDKAQQNLTPPWTDEAIKWGLRALIVLVLLAALYAVIRWGISLYKGYRAQQALEKQHPVITMEERQLQQNEYLELADQAFLSQHYREAIHYLFLAAVTQVIAHDQFHASQELTNREILRHCDFSHCLSPDAATTHFDHLVHHDERNWFGLQPVQANDYATMQAEYRAFADSLGRLPMPEVLHA